MPVETFQKMWDNSLCPLGWLSDHRSWTTAGSIVPDIQVYSTPWIQELQMDEHQIVFEMWLKNHWFYFALALPSQIENSWERSFVHFLKK